MMQVWLVLLGAVLLWQADKWAQERYDLLAMCMMTAGYGCLVVSVVLVFVNGGTTG